MFGEVSCCGTCRYHRKDKDHDWYCNNQDAEFYTVETDYGTEACEEYEERD